MARRTKVVWYYLGAYKGKTGLSNLPSQRQALCVDGQRCISHAIPPTHAQLESRARTWRSRPIYRSSLQWDIVKDACFEMNCMQMGKYTNSFLSVV
eukprot:6312717-Amphidinium_carterae.2